MAISPSLSSVSVAYYTEAGVEITDGSQEADGSNYARVTATIVDETPLPLANVQVRFLLDELTPDNTFRAEHGTVRPNGEFGCSFTNAAGQAYADIRSQNGGSIPLQIRILAGADDGRIGGDMAPTTTTVGDQTTNTATEPADLTVSAPEAFEDTLFQGTVTIESENVHFTDCTFDSAGAAAWSVISRGNAGVRFTNCTFKNTTSHAIIGHGFEARDCHFTDIGLSAVTLDSASTLLTTEIIGTRIERIGSEGAASAISASPGSRLRVSGCYIHAPHESSAAPQPGFQGRGALWAFTRRPNVATEFAIESSWLYGGGFGVIEAASLDNGNPPSGFRIEGNRIGSAALYQSPSTSNLFNLTVSGVTSAGNVDDDTGALIVDEDVNNIGGVAWLYPSTELDAQASVAFTEDVGATCDITWPVAAPGLSRPTSSNITTWSSDLYLYPPSAAVVRRASSFEFSPLTLGTPAAPGAGEEATEFVSVFGESARASYLSGYHDVRPTARVFPPTRVGDLAPAVPFVSFAAASQYRTVYETVGTVVLTIEASQVMPDTASVMLTYAGTATEGVDYTAPDEVFITAGTSSTTATITVINDAEVEGPETITVTISSVTGGIIGQIPLSRILVTNYADIGEPVPAPMVQMGQTVITGPIEATPATVINVPVNMSVTQGSDIDVSFEVNTSASTAVEGVDFTITTPSPVTIPTGETTVDIQITVIDDDADEPSEWLRLELTSVTGATVIGANNSTDIQIEDDDQPEMASVGFSLPSAQIQEGSVYDLVVRLSQAVVGTVTVPFTHTPSAGLTFTTEYTLTDLAGNTLTSPLVFNENETVKVIRVTSIEDPTPEAALETLDFELTSATGNATATGITNFQLTVVTGAGSDGQLHDLVPERVSVTLSTPDIEVTTTGYTIKQNVGLGIPSDIVVATSNPLQHAIGHAHVVWELLNAGNEATLQATAAIPEAPGGSLLEGVPVRIEIDGDMTSLPVSYDPNDLGNILTLAAGTEASPTLNEAEDWRFGSTDWPIVRDIVIYGKNNDPTVDLVGSVRLYGRYDSRVSGGTYDQRIRTVSNIRFERVGFEPTGGSAKHWYTVHENTNALANSTHGMLKAYDCKWFHSRYTYTGGALDREHDFCVKMASQRASYDFRNCEFSLTNARALDIDGVSGAFYAVDCTHEQGHVGFRGYPIGFARLSSRKDALGLNTVPPVAFGTAVFMRNTVSDTVAGPNASLNYSGAGGSDFTVAAFNGDVYFVDNNHIGAGDAGPTAGRALVTVWGSRNNRPAESTHNGTDYLVGSVNLYGANVMLDSPSESACFQISTAARVVVRGFNVATDLLPGWPVIMADSCGTALHDSIRYGNGIPSDDATHGWFWQLGTADPNPASTGWGNYSAFNGDPSVYAGWGSSSNNKMRCGRVRRQSNFPGFVRSLTAGEINNFDGTTPWQPNPPTQLPLSGFDNLSTGSPVGVTHEIILGRNNTAALQSPQMRSTRTQVITFERRLSNITTGEFTQTFLTPTLFTSWDEDAGSTGHGAGTMTYSYQDQWDNTYSDSEVPRIELDLVGSPTDPALPGQVRYQILSATGCNTPLIATNFYVYTAGSFGTFQWEPSLYPSGTVNLVVASGSTQTVRLTSTSDTHMHERVTLVGTTWPSTGLNVWEGDYVEFPPGVTVVDVPVSNITQSTLGDTVTLTIDSVEVNGLTAGNISANPVLSITATEAVTFQDRLNNNPFGAAVPVLEDLPVPTAADCDWLITNPSEGVWRADPVLPQNPYAAIVSGRNIVGEAYQDLRQRLLEDRYDPVTPDPRVDSIGIRDPMTFGIYGDGGKGRMSVEIGHKLGINGVGPYPQYTIFPVGVRIVGLTDDAVMETGVEDNGDHATAEHIAFECYNIGFRAIPTTNAHCKISPGVGPEALGFPKTIERVIIDGCWFPKVPSESFPTLHGINFQKNSGFVVVRNLKVRGLEPVGGSPANFQQHNIYFKSVLTEKGMWILNNEFYGGQRTCFQIRPDTGVSESRGPIVIMDNTAVDYGWHPEFNHQQDNGGQAMTIWSSPTYPVFISGNTITRPRYGALGAFGQGEGPLGNPVAFMNPNGTELDDIYVWDNVLGNEHPDHNTGPNEGPRSPLSAAGIQKLHLGHNTFPDEQGLEFNNPNRMGAGVVPTVDYEFIDQVIFDLTISDNSDYVNQQQQGGFIWDLERKCLYYEGPNKQNICGPP